MEKKGYSALCGFCCLFVVKNFSNCYKVMKKSTKKFVEEDKEKFPPVSYLKSTKKTRKRNRKVYKVTSYERVPRSSDRDLGNEGHTEGQPLKEIRKPGIYRAGDIHRNQLLSLAALTPQGPVYGKTAKHLCSLGTPVKAAHSDE